MKLKYLDICPTWRCNAKCPTCNSYNLEKTIISHEQIDVILKEKKFDGLRRVVIEGGEPTLWNDLEYFIRGMLDKGTKKICVITNGFLTTRLKNIGYRFQFDSDRVLFYLSLNGIGQTHDESRGVKNVFSKTVHSATALKQIGFFVSFSFVGLQRNIGEYDDVVQLGLDLGIPVAVCYYTHRTKFGDQTWDAAIPVEYNKLLDKRRRTYKGFARRAYGYFLRKVRKGELLPCDAGKDLIHINPDGLIRPCHMDDSI